MPDVVQLTGDAAITPIAMNGGGEVLPCVCWSKDGASFFTLDKGGTLIRWQAAGLKEAARANLGVGCSWLSLSAEGLVVTASGQQEVWLVDPATLQPQKKIAAPGAIRAVSAPAASLALAGGNGGFGSKVSMIDLKAGQVVQQYPNIGFQHAVMSPDGKYLFVQEGIEQLVRLPDCRHWS